MFNTLYRNLVIYQRFVICSLLSIILASCAYTAKQSEPGDAAQAEENITASRTNYKYPAWAVNNAQQLGAINALLDESDQLIEVNALNEAADKLERVLRIKPRYAPAWSRLSWIALQTDRPSRSVEMAKRSNSFAQSDTELLLLNWSFIRTASQRLNDEGSYRQAEQQIQSLKSL
jgi:hypothetical protein